MSKAGSSRYPEEEGASHGAMNEEEAGLQQMQAGGSLQHHGQ